MDTSLQPMQRCIAPIGGDQLIMAAVFDQPAPLDGYDAIGRRTVDSRWAMMNTVRPVADLRML